MTQLYNQFPGLIKYSSDDESSTSNKDTALSIFPFITEVMHYPQPTFFPFPIEDGTPCPPQRPNIFNVTKHTNRGRKPKDNKILGKKHKGSDFDNIQTKIQVHFINFLIDFANDAINTEFKEGKPVFDKINYQDKKKIQFDYLQKLFSSPINQIITLNASAKYKNHWNFRLNHNKIVYEKLTKESPWLKSFLDIIYIDMFEKYYNNKDYLLKKNKVITKEIIDTTEKVYLNRKNEKNPFKTNKFDD